MQTFLPYPDFARSAEVLDDRRLGKQRVEAYQILRTLLGVTRGWRHHPAVRMWRGHELALISYGLAVCAEWRGRGFTDHVADTLMELSVKLLRTEACGSDPPWLGDADFHRSHRSNLLRKAPGHYAGLSGFDVPADLPLVWPVRQEALT